MTNFIDTLDALPRPHLAPDELNDLIAAAQAGDKAASLAVLREHLGIFVNEIDRSVRLVTNNGFAADSQDIRDDVTSDALQVFFRVLAAYDPERAKTTRFAGLFKTALRRDENMTSAINRTRTLRIPLAVAARRAAAIKEAGGDMEVARTLAKKHKITPATFDAIGRVYQEPTGLQAQQEASTAAGGATDQRRAATEPEEMWVREPGYVRVETLEDAARALDALDFTSRLIVESAFGLNDQPQQSNAEIGERLGLSRWAVQRRVEAAILTMQQALSDKETDQ